MSRGVFHIYDLNDIKGTLSLPDSGALILLSTELTPGWPCTCLSPVHTKHSKAHTKTISSYCINESGDATRTDLAQDA